jgi:lysophospholipase L1-like esterase
MKSFVLKTFVWKSIMAAASLLLTLLAACDPVIDPVPGSRARGKLVADTVFINYVALGNSLTAGLQAGAVVGTETQYAYPVLLARQMGMAIGEGNGQFAYMRFNFDEGLGVRLYVQQFNPDGTPSLDALPMQHRPSNASVPRPYNNLGIPGALLSDMQPPANPADPVAQLYAARVQANPFFAAVLRSPALGRTVLDQAVRLNPNLVTLFIGSNDVLEYAITGGTDTTSLEFRLTRRPQPTDPRRFAAMFAALMDSCAKRMPNAKFIVGNVPDVTAAPYFTTVRRQLLASGVNVNGLIVRSQLSPAQGGLPAGFRRISDADLLLLPGVIGFPVALASGRGRSVQQPLDDALVLDSLELALVRSTTQQYNQAISAAVARYSAGKRAVLFDTFAFVNAVAANGYPVTGSLVLRFDFLSGGFFSVDGLHPSSRGYAAFANELLRLFNREYEADFPLVSLQDIPGIVIGSAQ